MLLTLHIYYVRIYNLHVHSLIHATGLVPHYCSGLGFAPTSTPHAQNVLHSETKLKERLKKIGKYFFERAFDLVSSVQHALLVRSGGCGGA